MEGQTGCGTERQPASRIDARWSSNRGDGGGRGGRGVTTTELGHGDCNAGGKDDGRGDVDGKA